MKTSHKVFINNSAEMGEVETNSIDLLITSPPYPMIEMWDMLFSSLNDEIKIALDEKDGNKAFDLMHEELDRIWRESKRVLKSGGIACINIGDATRKLHDTFQLFSNHVRITRSFLMNGFVELPPIIWRKPTNSPNKFLGSGMIPPNGYVTLEHEYILIFRSGTSRIIKSKSEKRYNSAFFWEERNKWFSDIWVDVKGVSQKLNSNQKNLRKRSAAFPLELPYRLINMFSVYGDTVLDPFWGTGTTSMAAMISSRNSIGYEINSNFLEIFNNKIDGIKQLSEDISTYYTFPVITKQEREILFYIIDNYHKNKDEIILNYKKFVNKASREDKL
ncbi:MAG: DNA-methyltransferase [Promethearchaeota archaeon]|jgi:DNA modification methylase